MKNFIIKTIPFFLLICSPLVLFSQIEVLISDRADNSVNKYDLDGNFVEVFIEPNSGGISNPQDIVFLPNDNVLMTGFGNNTIKEYDGTTGDYIGVFSTGYSLQGPTRMELREDGYIYVLQWSGNYKVVRFDMNGVFDSEYTDSGVFQSIGIDWDESGNLYVSSYGQGSNGLIKYFDSSGNEIGIFGDSSLLAGATNIWFQPDGSGNLLALDYNGNRLAQFDSSGTFLSFPITGLATPEGYAYLPNGNLLISERGADKISEFDADFNLIGRWDHPSGNLSGPNFIRIRDTNLSTSENIMEAPFIYPTIGENFYFNTKNISAYDQVNIYDFHGKLIDSIDPNKDLVWNASFLPNGMYLMVAKSKSGKRRVQKIIVKKE